MDTSEQYIKLCEKAEEIQEPWRKPMVKEVGEVIANPHTHAVLIFNGQYVCPENVIWLPRQDQLQEMIDWNVHQLTSRFSEMVHYEAGDDKSLFASMEQLWLAFVMKERWNKTWNGEGWELPEREG